jgi:hypothetical protein
MLLVAGIVIYGLRLALAGQWKELVIAIVVLLLVIWILGAFGLHLPNLP